MEKQFLVIKELTECCRKEHYLATLEFEETEDAEQRLLQIFKFLLEEI